MNKAQFITLIENPENLDKSHVSALKNIVSDFPFFQAGHILLAKALFNENHYEFEKQLKSTALMVSNRELLYRFLQNIAIEKTVPASFSEEMPVPEDVILDAVLDIRDEPETEENNIDEIRQEEIITEVVPIQEPEVLNEIKNEEIKETEEVHGSDDTIIADVNPIEKSVEQIPVNPKIAPDEKHSFTEWLTLAHELPKEEEPNVESVKEVPPEETTSVVSEDIKDDKNSEATPKSNIPEFESLLDKFIKENPSISRPKAEFYNPANMAKQSVEEDDDLITETLANIYYKQGAYKKAIRAYEKLCLIYPHKMSYFASLIQKIKDENKNE